MKIAVSAKMNVETGAMTYTYAECDPKVFADYIKSVMERVTPNGQAEAGASE